MSQPAAERVIPQDSPSLQRADTGAAIQPIDLFPSGADPLSPAQQARWIWVFLAIGVTLRLVRYLLRFPLWEDESWLSANYIHRGYLDLLRPLDYFQVCPTGFLWAQLTMVKLLGFTEYALRLIPFLCGMASLFLFRHVAGRLLRGTALVLAIGIFAVAYPMTRYAAEAKPYGCDLFLALVMLALVIQWLDRPGENRWLWALAALIGPALWFSYPAVFVGGGFSLAIGWALWSSGRRGWIAWVVYNLVLVGSFAGVLAMSRMAVGDTNQGRMVGDWAATFPPLAQPTQLLKWLFTIHSGGMLGYPVGGPRYGSTLTLLCCLAAIILLARRRQWLLLLIMLAPLGLNFLAAALHRYPYGGHSRMTLYEGWAFCMLTALGMAIAIRWLAGLKKVQHRPLIAVLTVLVALAAAALFRDLSHPYKSTTTLRAREFARWFWSDLAQNSELVCVRSDLKEDLSPGTFDYGWSCLYLCNQRIYSPRHARGEKPDCSRISADWPLRCVVFRSREFERDSKPLDRWVEEMQLRYRLVSRDTYPFAAYNKWDREHKTTDLIEVFKFVPIEAAGLAETRPGDTRRR